MKKTYTMQDKLGESRLIQKFLYLPVRIKNERRWLEKVVIKRIYVETYSIFGSVVYKWINLGFVNNKSYKDKNDRRATPTEEETGVVRNRRGRKIRT